MKAVADPRSFLPSIDFNSIGIQLYMEAGIENWPFIFENLNLRQGLRRVSVNRYSCLSTSWLY
jgi:hypothetical protein